MFGYEDGWAASHCQIGALAPMQALVFGWLEQAINATVPATGKDLGDSLDVLMRYAGRGAVAGEAAQLVGSLRAEGARAKDLITGAR